MTPRQSKSGHSFSKGGLRRTEEEDSDKWVTRLDQSRLSLQNVPSWFLVHFVSVPCLSPFAFALLAIFFKWLSFHSQEIFQRLRHLLDRFAAKVVFFLFYQKETTTHQIQIACKAMSFLCQPGCGVTSVWRCFPVFPQTHHRDLGLLRCWRSNQLMDMYYGTI